MNKRSLRKYISECVRHYLREAMNDSFNFNKLSELGSFAARIRYCKEHLGFPIGNGSSRMVFQLDDEKCLKLAKNEKGLAQNDVEYDKEAESYDVTPNLYSHAEDNSWIVTEYVLPAKASDFKKCLGIDFNTFRNFVICCYNSYARSGRQYHTEMSDEEFVGLLENNEWLKQLYNYMGDYQLPCGDLVRMTNLGMVMRYGKPYLVILDSGLSQDVFDRYYSRRR